MIELARHPHQWSMQSGDALDTARGTLAPIRRFSALERGDEIGRYVILGTIGRGGMGVVYSAYDPELDRRIAIKLVHPGNAPFGATAGTRERLTREARAMARVSHPNVIAVHDVGDLGDDVFIAMEFVEGTTLGAWAGARDRHWREVVDVLLEAGAGLAAAHEAGLVHRDFKPDNTMIGSDQRVRVLDFGLALAAGSMLAADDSLIADTFEDSGPRERSAVVGTPAYMAPEQLLGDAGDELSDQFSFCVTAYELLFGQRPFEGNTLNELVINVTDGKVRPPPRSSVPGFVADAVLRGLQVRADHRWPSIAALLAELRRDPRRRRRRWVGVGAASVLLVGGAAGWRVDEHRIITSCQQSGAEIASVWGPDEATRLRRGLLSTSAHQAAATADRVGQALDRYAQGWAEGRTDACMATRVDDDWSDAELARSIECFDERRAELGALVDILSDPDEETARHAVASASSLPRLSVCTNRGRLAQYSQPPTDPGDRERARALRIELARARALQAAGQYDRGRELARVILDRAEDLGHEPLIADSYVRLGVLASVASDLEAAERNLERGFVIAGRIGRDLVAADAATELASITGVMLARPDDGQRWARFAKMLLQRTGHVGGLREASLLRHVGNIAYARAAYDRAIGLHLAALRIRRELLGDDHPDVAGLLNDLAVIHSAAGELDDAVTYQMRALLLTEAIYGPGHSEVAVALHNLGSILFRLDHTRDAVVYQRRAIAIKEKALGRDHVSVAMSLTTLAASLEHAHEYDEALGYHERALEIMRAALPPDHPSLAGPNHGIADVLLRRRQYGEAKKRYSRAIRLWAPDPNASRNLAHSLFGMCKSLIGLESDEEAARYCVRSLAVMERQQDPWDGTATPVFELAERARDRGDSDTATEMSALALYFLERTNAPQEKIERARKLAQLLPSTTRP